jgi:hypothetical protein
MAINKIKSSSGYLGPEPKSELRQYNIVEDRVEKIYKIVVHEFLVADMEDPEIYAAEPIWKWQQTEAGKWIMEHAAESPVWHRALEAQTLSYRFKVVAKLRERDYTFWCLKWADTVARQRR